MIPAFPSLILSTQTFAKMESANIGSDLNLRHLQQGVLHHPEHHLRCGAFGSSPGLPRKVGVQLAGGWATWTILLLNHEISWFIVVFIVVFTHISICIYIHNIPYLPRTYIIISLIYQLYHCLFTIIHPYLPPLLRKSYPHGTEVQRPGAFGSHLGAPCGWHRGAHTGAYTHG